MSDPDKVWDLHKTIYKQLKKRAQSLEGSVSRELKSYERNQRKYANREFKGATIDELFSAIRNSHVVFLGDFHSFDQNTRNLERLTRELIKQKNKFSLGVELVGSDQQYAIDLYLDHKITELEFLEEIDYHKSWRFPWSYYRPFFEMARKHHLQIVALNSDGTLEERDLRAAETIGEALKKNPNERFLILFGELHIVPNKLPARLEKIAGDLIENYRATIIHQNLDEVFWKIHEVEIEKHNQIVKFGDREFSLQTAPPWIKYESMIYWYENLSDDPEFELHDYILNTGILNLHSNVPENFLFLCEKIRKTLEFDVSDEEMEDFNLYEHQNLSIVSDKVGRIPKATLSNFYKRLISVGRVFRIPFSNNYYCSSYSINRISFICGLHLQDITIRKKNINYESILMEAHLEKKFILFLKQSSIGYLASKVINPFRKCDLYLDFKEKFTYSQGDKETLEVYESLINIIEAEGCEDFKNLLVKKSHLHIYEVARKLGFYFGEVLYEDFLIRGSEKYGEVFQYLNNDVCTYHTFWSTLRILIPRESFNRQKKRMF